MATNNITRLFNKKIKSCFRTFTAQIIIITIIIITIITIIIIMVIIIIIIII